MFYFVLLQYFRLYNYVCVCFFFLQKFVLKLDLEEDRDKRRALKTVAALSGIDEITIDMKGKKLMVVDIISVGPPKEPEKKEKGKKDEEKKEEGKKEYPKKEGEKMEKAEPDPVVGTVMPFRQYYPPINTYYYVHHSMEENPNACAIP
ncbi:hypothetical protein SASPL_106037 [Salvia splendens]|uniref:HMA domain-containing protein n=1 Tax=Salvia splendens TaxID=180675 RepID=A0A8X8YQQ5_SALSN|nr:hypothetical protein SASPL_106037 [Salvia splendens]